MSEEQAESAFEALRFASSGGQPFCVWCQCPVVYRITRTVKHRITRTVKHRKTGAVTTRRLFKCTICLKQFSVTSGTMFHGRKLSFRKIMTANLLFTNGAAGLSALKLRRDIHCNHKTAWKLEHKIRETMLSYTVSRRLTGDVEMDATEIGGKVRKANRAVDRKGQPRRNMAKVTTLSVARERGPEGRIVPFLGNESAMAKAISTVLDPEAWPIVDEHPGWTTMYGKFAVRQIKHKDQYSDLKGISTNLAESYWSRFKQMYNGTYRSFSGRYAQAYNGECAWREEHRRQSNGAQFVLAMAGALNHPPSPIWRGYDQRTRRKGG